MTDDTKPRAGNGTTRARRPLLIGATAAFLALAGAGLFLAQPERVAIAQDIAPTPIGSLQASSLTAAKGVVDEIFGNTFVLRDASGRALIETGPQGVGGKLVSKGESVTVTGRFEDGIFHAARLAHADGSRVTLGPLAPPPGPVARAKERLGVWPRADVAELTARVQQAGFTDIRVAGRGPRHLDMVAKDKDGHDRDLHVDLDGGIEERL